MLNIPTLMAEKLAYTFEKAGRQDFMHMIARPLMNKDIENRKTM